MSHHNFSQDTLSQDILSTEARPATLLKKRLWHRCFPVLQNTSGDCFYIKQKTMKTIVCYRVKSHCSIERKVMIGLIDPKVIIKFPLTSKKEEKIYKADLSYYEKFL